MSWIATVEPSAADGVLGAAYAVQQERLGEVTELTQVGSLYPDLVARRLALYDVSDHLPSGVPDWGRRAVALVVSALNECKFCTVGHTVKLEEAGRGALAAAIKADPVGAASGDPAIDALLGYARKLTSRPGEIDEADVAALRAAGWSDADIVDINNLAAYYSYINRVATGLGLTREA